MTGVPEGTPQHRERLGMDAEAGRDPERWGRAMDGRINRDTKDCEAV